MLYSYSFKLFQKHIHLFIYPFMGIYIYACCSILFSAISSMSSSLHFSLISLTYYHSFLAFIIRMPSLKFWKSLGNQKLDSRNFSFWQQAGACRECREERRKPAGNVWKRIQMANICSDSEIITYFFKIFLKPIAVKLHLLNTIVKGKT